MVLDWTKYPNFSPKEFHCKCASCKGQKGAENMNERVLEGVQKMRTAYGSAIKGTSGYRCEKHPDEVRKPRGPGSHNRGQSFDIACSGQVAYQLLKLAIEAGFTRIGVKQKGSGRFLHIQMPDTKQSIPWIFSY